MPRWRTMIDPAGTTWPANTFTPRNFGFESRPLRLEPPPFLWAISRSLPQPAAIESMRTRDRRERCPRRRRELRFGL